MTTDAMPQLDFSRAKRVEDVPALARLQQDHETKERITIRLDADVLAWFREQVRGGGSYQALINHVLRVHMQDAQGSLERMLRRVLREELRHVA